MWWEGGSAGSARARGSLLPPGGHSGYDEHKDGGEGKNLVVSETFGDIGVEPLTQFIYAHLDIVLCH